MPWEQPLQQILDSIQGPGRENHGRDRHHRHRPVARIRRYQWRISAADPDRVRILDRFRRFELLPLLLLLQRRSAAVMENSGDDRRLLRAGPSRADRSDPARRRAACGRYRQWHARRRHRARPAAVDSRSRDLGGRTRRRRLGGEARRAVRRRCSPPSPLPIISAGMRDQR